jgi:hypothetical protein
LFGVVVMKKEFGCIRRLFLKNLVVLSVISNLQGTTADFPDEASSTEDQAVGHGAGMSLSYSTASFSSNFDFEIQKALMHRFYQLILGTPILDDNGEVFSGMCAYAPCVQAGMLVAVDIDGTKKIGFIHTIDVQKREIHLYIGFIKNELEDVMVLFKNSENSLFFLSETFTHQLIIAAFNTFYQKQALSRLNFQDIPQEVKEKLGKDARPLWKNGLKIDHEKLDNLYAGQVVLLLVNTKIIYGLVIQNSPTKKSFYLQIGEREARFFHYDLLLGQGFDRLRLLPA